MRITTKLMLLILSIVLSLGITSMAVSFHSIKKQRDIEVKATEDTLLNYKTETLKTMTDNAYSVIEASYNEAHDMERVRAAVSNKLKNAVDIAYGSLDAIYQGGLSSSEATDSSETDEKKKGFAIKAIGSLRYDSDTPFWIVDTDLKMIVNPKFPELIGKDVSDLKDIQGNNLFPALLKDNIDKGDAWFNYMWQKKGTTSGINEPDPKIVYARVFKPWSWIIGSALSLEVVEKGFQDRGKEVVATLRYGPEKTDYFWIHKIAADDNAQFKMVMHPIKPELDEKDISTIKDPAGKYLFREMNSVCREKGDGFVKYLWPKPGEDKPVSKISYVKLFEPYGWVVGTGLYVDDIKKAVAKKEAEMNTMMLATIIKQALLMALICLVIVIITFLVARKISSPLIQTSLMLKEIAEGEGDLTRRILVHTKDEAGEVAHWFNQFVEHLQQMILKIKENAVLLTSNAAEMLSLSQMMRGNAESIFSKVNGVNRSSEEMNANMQSVASAMEETTTNVNMVAGATEEMNSTINEIAKNTSTASKITNEAVNQSTMAKENVSQMALLAVDIGKITEVITEISDQTNLLALNATIESARAGEAGKGFAVVASEIKALASQTAEATLKIKGQIGRIQGATKLAGENIHNISAIVDQINEIVSGIAGAIEEQSVTTNEISRNVSQSSEGIAEINENLSQTSSATTEITHKVAEINNSAADMSSSCAKVDENAGRLNDLARSLNEMVNRFKT